MRKRLTVLCLFLLTEIVHAQTPLFERFEFGNDEINASISTSSGELYFGSTDGLYLYFGFGFEKIESKELKGPVSADHFLEDRDGGLFVLSSNRGLLVMEEGSFKPFSGNEDLLGVLNNQSINDAQIHDSILWFSLKWKGGLYKFNLRNAMLQKHIFSESADFAYFIQKVAPGKYICGANDAGLFKEKLFIYSDGLIQEVKLSDINTYRKSTVEQLSDGSLVFSVGQEMIHLNNKQILSRIFQEEEVSSVHEDIEGKLWVGLKNDGLVCYPNGLEETSNQVRYLRNTSISSISENVIGELWISTFGEGVYQFNPGTSTDYQAPALFSDFDSSDAPKEAIALEERDLGPKGDFNPNHLVKDSLPPKIFITGVRIMGEDTSILSDYDLGFRQNFIEISYLGFAQSSTLIQYRYQMEGVNEDWVYTSRQLAQYTTLPPGNYTFRVEAVNKDGVWSESPASLKFTINPPFWQTNWFRLVLVLSTILLTAIIWYLTYLRIKRKSQKREAYNRKLAQVELQALRAQMNPHFLFNTLSSIQHFITLNRNEDAINYLSKFAKLMRVILDNSKSPEIPLKDELSALRIYLELESLRFKDKFDFSIEVDENLDVNYDQIPPLLIQPYVENAIMHGIMHLDKKGMIKVRIEHQGNFMKVLVEDNGVGRERSKELEKHKMHQSRGMSITKDRLEIINSSRKSSLNLKITDLKDDKAKALGTRVEIFIPLED